MLKKMDALAVVAVFATTFAISACTTTKEPTVVNPVALQGPLPISEGQKQECQEVAPALGDSKLSIIEKANIEIDDCEKKRAGLQDTIETENSRRKVATDAEVKRIATE